MKILIGAIALLFVTLANSETLKSQILISAVAEATIKCDAVGADTLEICSSVTGRGPVWTAARTAVSKAFDARLNFMRQCELESSSLDCIDLAEFYFYSGFEKAGIDRHENAAR